MKKHRTSTSDFFATSKGSLPDTLAAALAFAFANAPHPLRLDDILHQTGIPRRLKRDVLTELHRQADAGLLLRLHGGTWIGASSLKTIMGTLAIQRSGTAFVTPSTTRKGDVSRRQDIYIASDGVGDAWNGDEVEVILLPGQHGPSVEGRVSKVIRRGQTELSVRVVRPPRPMRFFSAAGEEENSSDRSIQTPMRDRLRVLARPMDPRLNFVLLVDVTNLSETPQRGDLLRVTVGEPLPSPRDNPLLAGTALIALGREDDVAVQEQLTKFNHRIPASFPDDVRAEAEAVAQAEPSAYDAAHLPDGVVDIRSLPLVTIDGEDARDFDDAVYVGEQKNGWRLVVAIADVSLYVRSRSRLDREARERGNSCYFPTSVEPMLPEALSNGVCSLLPDEDRRVMIADMDLDALGNPRGMKFYAGVMRSRARLTYTQTQLMLDGGVSGNVPPEIPAMLTEAGRLASALIERRRKQGGLDFDIPEAEFITEKGRVTAVRNRQRLFSHRLIEAFMVTANEAVATFLTQKDAPFLYRAHPEPSPEKLNNLVRALRATGLSLPLPSTRKEPGKDSAKDVTWLSTLLTAASSTEQAYLVGRLVLRSMMQARYTPDLEGHFGLASACYCHFTSPIRRYADLVTHRALRHALGLNAGGSIPTGHALLTVAETCNTREQAAQDAEREITRRLGCLLLEKHVGENFRGVISGVTSFGLFVEFENMPLEGMIRVETLGQDYFEYNADRQELRGRDTNAAWRLGQAVDVRLAEVNVGRLEITLLLAGTPDTALAERKRGRKIDGQTGRHRPQTRGQGGRGEERRRSEIGTEESRFGKFAGHKKHDGGFQSDARQAVPDNKRGPRKQSGLAPQRSGTRRGR